MNSMDCREETLVAVSPSAQYYTSSTLSLTILGVLELESPLDIQTSMELVKDVFLPINHRFSSIMVSKEGEKKWQKVEVNIEDHVTLPVFPIDMSTDYYEECFYEYLSKLAMEKLPENRPLWEIHIVKYPTKNAAETLIFKLHHALGDGYSLMGALLSCLQRRDDPSIPLTFPSRQSNFKPSRKRHDYFWRIPHLFSGLINTAYDFGLNVLKSSLFKDDISPIRSGNEGVEFRPIVITTIEFAMDDIKQIKDTLKVTFNDVITGTIIFGTRLYMQKKNQASAKANCTALVVLNTRAIGGYKSVNEMIKPNAEMPWGNKFSFLQVPIPKLTDSELNNPLQFVKTARQLIKRQRNSASLYLIAQFLDTITKVRGSEATAKHIHSTLKNSSLAISNVMGPVEQMALANRPVKGVYYALAGMPQSLVITMVSYVGKLRVSIGVEKGFIDPREFKSCINRAFEAISKDAVGSSPALTKS